MKRKAPPALTWSRTRSTYLWLNDESVDNPLWYQDSEPWFRWLKAHHSFSFQGQHGRLNLLKETRQRGEEGYWYAYRSQGKRTLKRYVGRSSNLTIEHLEEIVWKLTNETTLRTPEGHPSLRLEQSAEQQLPFLLPKLQPPPLPVALFRRERLLTLLDTALQSPLTLLVASAGSGKTTLMRQWMIERAAQTTKQFPLISWISLDAADNDPIRFWNYLLTACQFDQPHQEALARLLGKAPPFVISSTDPAFPRIEEADPRLTWVENREDVQRLHAIGWETFLGEVVSTFLYALAHLPREVILVLENYQTITSPHLHESVALFLDHLPAHVHLSLLTRSEPSLPLAYLRANSRLCEVTERDLRFSLEEMSAFLQQVIPRSLSTPLLHALDARLQGWAAGLRLLAFTLQRTEKPLDDASLLALLDGRRHPFLEYFVSEVFLLQPLPLQDFLLQTCLLGSLNSSLCDALLGGNESAVHLNTLAQTHLYLERFERSGAHLTQETQQWYHYHPLFAEAMLHLARQRFGMEHLRAQAEQAIRWYLLHNLLPDAIEITLAVGESVQAAALIEQFLQIQVPSRSLWDGQQTHLLRRWLTALPSDLVRCRPLLALGWVEGLFFTSVVEQQPFLPQSNVQVEELLLLAEEGFRAQGNLIWLNRLLFTRALMERRAGDINQAANYVRQQGPAGVPDLRFSLSMHVLGNEELLTGQVEKAIQIFLEARSFIEQFACPMIMRSNSVLLGRAYFEYGEFYLAAEYFLQLLASARQEKDFDDIGDAQLGLAQISYEWNQLADAKQQALEASEMGERLTNEEFHVQAALVLARIEQVQGQNAQAQQRCRVLLTRYPPTSPGLTLRHRLRLEIQATLAWLWFKNGDLPAVERWVSQRQPVYGWRAQSEREDLLIARLLLTQGKPEKAREISGRVTASAGAGGHQRIALQAQLLLSLADASSNCLPEARKQLYQVVVQACSEGYMRLFLDEGEPMQMLLQSLSPTLREETQRTYLRHLLLAFAQERASGVSPSQTTLIEPLSRQEQRVLQSLCTGQTNQEIADELIVSVNTVRTQVRSIYQKLNVKNRVEAGELARQLKLL